MTRAIDKMTGDQIKKKVLPEYGMWILDCEQRSLYKLVDKALKFQREVDIAKINKMLEPTKLHLCWITEDGDSEPISYGLADERGDEIDTATLLPSEEGK